MSRPTHVEREQPVDVAVDPRLSRGVKAFWQRLHAAGGPPLATFPPLAARAVLAHAQAAVPVELSGIAESETTITAEGDTLPLHIVRPAGATGPRPVFLFLHGGGWVLGDDPTHQRMVRDLAVLSGVPGVFVHSTRTPEARYPQAVQEIYAATQWGAAHGEELGGDGQTLAVGGKSVGGKRTAVTALKAKEQGGPAITLQSMMWPIVDATCDTASSRQCGEQRFLTTSLMRWRYDLYTTAPKERQAISASPLPATVEQVQGLPPALIQGAESDLLRDEGEAYGRKLDAAGVTVTTGRDDGMIHDFGLLNG